MRNEADKFRVRGSRLSKTQAGLMKRGKGFVLVKERGGSIAGGQS